MDSLIIALAAATFFSTLLGGGIILRFKDSLPYFFAFAAGSLMGVAFLDILPESLEIAGDAGLPLRWIMIAIVLSFFFYHLVERYFATHHMAEGEAHVHACGHDHGHVLGPIGAGSLVVHSLLDGAAIGAAFQVNASVGLVVALAVIFHDFTDGINTVTIMLKNRQQRSRAILFLILDALAPVVGVIAVSAIAIPQSALALVLAVFVGEFIYIGAANLLPATHEHHSKKILLAMALGVGVIMLLTSLL